VAAVVVLVTAVVLPGGLARGASADRRQSTVLRVAAASDLKFALDEVVAGFSQQQTAKIDVVYGSSGTLMRQIADGAPFELFLSADETYVDELARMGAARDRGVLYATGRIVIFAPKGSRLQVDPQLAGLKRLLTEGRLTRFAIANPEHAPYGRAAEAVLRKYGMWTAIQPRLALGENIAQAAQFATTGGADGGILAYSLVVSPTLKDAGAYALIPAQDHPPIRQRMALLRSAGPTAQALYSYLQQPPARRILERHGFQLPGGSS
jgi:molybdate transport system substrate-binding protein